MIPVGRSLPAALAACAWLALPLGCEDTSTRAARTDHGAARPLEIDELRATAERALDDGRVDDALRIARFLVERRGDATCLELLGRTHLADAARADARGVEASVPRREAAAAYAAAADLDRTNAGLQHAAAMVLDSAGLREAALPLFDRAVAAAPRNAEFLLHRAFARLRGGDVKGAADDAATMGALAPADPWRFALDAEIALAIGQPADAARTARRAVDASPDTIGFRILLSRCQRADGRAEDAVLGLRGLDATARAFPAVAAELALGYAALARPRDAALAWEAAMNDIANADDASVATETARAWLDANEPMRARAAIDELRRRAPDHESIAALESTLRHSTSLAPTARSSHPADGR